MYDVLKLQVVTYKPKFANSDPHDLSQWEIESTKQIDHNNSSDRKWLGSHCFWAFRSKRQVRSFAI